MAVSTPITDPATTEVRRTPSAVFESPYGGIYRVTFQREGVLLNAAAEVVTHTTWTSHERSYDVVADEEIALGDGTIVTVGELWEGFSKVFDRWEAEDVVARSGTYTPVVVPPPQWDAP